MSRARMKVRKKCKPWWLTSIQVFLALLVFAVASFTIIEAAKTQLFSLIAETLLLDTKVLIILAVNVFVIGGILLVLLYQWAERDNIRFKMKQKAYRSMLISPDYYQSLRRIKVDQFMVGSVPDAGTRKLDIDYDLKKSSFVTIDTRRIVREARQTHIAFVNGRLSGHFKTYFTNGNVLAEVNYEKGVLDGRCVIYYPNGSLHNEKHFKNGRLHGIFKAWDEDGALFFEISYENDIQHGPDKIYRKNGILEYEDIYDKGKLVQRKTFDEFGQFKYMQKFGSDGEGASLITDADGNVVNAPEK